MVKKKFITNGHDFGPEFKLLIRKTVNFVLNFFLPNESIYKKDVQK